MSEEWGPWIKWGGRRAVPSGVHVGDWYQGVGIDQEFVEKRVENNRPCNWALIEEFRIRKPRGLTILEEVASGVREPVDA